MFINLEGVQYRQPLSGDAGATKYVTILEDINLAIDNGETVSIIGPSGSGKTSLLMLIASLEAPSAGSVKMGAHDLGSMSEDALARLRSETIGIVFQDFHLIPTMTALENVAIPLEFGGIKNAEQRARESLEAVNLGHRLQHYPSQLSGGEQQRVALARAFVVRPKVLLADEPTGNLDSKSGNQVTELLFKMQETYGTTLILITHDTVLAQRCKRIIELRDGRVYSDSANS